METKCQNWTHIFSSVSKFEWVYQVARQHVACGDAHNSYLSIVLLSVAARG